MIGHLSLEQRERYSKLTMAPDELLAASEHLAGCPECRDQIAASIPVIEQIADVQADLTDAASAPSHLSFELMQRFLEDQLGSTDREIVNSHLAICRGCAEEMEDLRRFRVELADRPSRIFGSVKQTGLLERFRSWQFRMRSQP